MNTENKLTNEVPEIQVTASAAFVEPAMKCFNEIICSIWQAKNTETLRRHLVDPVVVVVVREPFNGCLDLR